MSSRAILLANSTLARLQRFIYVKMHTAELYRQGQVPAWTVHFEDVNKTFVLLSSIDVLCKCCKSYMHARPHVSAREMHADIDM